ncbi:UDP-N-acetylmuramoyl-tripeptide--D-alanyl-D-alanine ligase [Corynebacterium poyangense]|uniref:UDP-N-acetylmuramoyl-tripeptide--D-alanyl-D-alanine ligase n=1 Tax=Corynebacterium poyangense TaxID=2684405 RepID=A0A7H0SPT7_9CORY|nr:UDP-N-acetylmuramoyl-tripeptide--D-alanyl-D-alanine ligase [Corynebacterium poyangense]QNQ90562.1 UDP-N-acetylmuramoyl-tripeptide--D-alanyl-D-alanine ligase [Corynebacterium poyangense]
MIELSLKEIADIVGGRLDQVTDPDHVITGAVEFDSRKISLGDLFIALPGARVDGHDFAAQAVHQAGATAVLAARPVGVPAIIVEPRGPASGNAEAFAHDEDGSASAVIGALSSLAREVMRRLVKEGLTIIGITGSAGKTSTKDLVAKVVSHAGPTIAPPGSFNNELGHPYTALRCTKDTKFLVAEMSARGLGHITHLAHIAPPHIGVVLNVGSAHLGEFGSRQNIAQAKGELVAALPEDGIAILNADDPFVIGMSARTTAKVVSYSVATPPAVDADIYASNIDLDDIARAAFDLHLPREETRRVHLGVFGAHQVSNALAAAAVGQYCGLGMADIVTALEEAKPASAHRMDVHTRGDGVTVINDSYNANPESMRAGIAALAYTASARPDAHSFAVLGEMGELGEESVAEHVALATELARFHITELIAVDPNDGECCRAMCEAATREGINTEIALSVDEAMEILRNKLNPKDVVLVKASNAQRLWQVAEALMADCPAPAATPHGANPGPHNPGK